MERIKNTLMLLLLAIAALFASCSDDKDKPEPTPDPTPDPIVQAVNYTLDFTSVTKAAYLGDKYTSGDGNFHLALTNADGDVLELDLMSLKASKPSVAMPLAGTYTAAQTHKAGTYVASASFWQTSKKGTEVLKPAANIVQPKKFTIASGNVTLTAKGDGTYTLAGVVSDGLITNLTFTWSGALSFVNESGDKDPIVYQTLTMVYGDYYTNDYSIPNDTYMLRSGNENYELWIRLRSIAPLDSSKLLPNDGEYTIDLRSADETYANNTFTFRSGYKSGSSAVNTYWKTEDKSIYVATSGSFTVSTVGSDWKIQGTLRDDAAEKDFSFTYIGTPTFKL